MFKSFREHQGLTQEALGQLIGLSASFVNSVESGERPLTATETLAYERFFKVYKSNPQGFHRLLEHIDATAFLDYRTQHQLTNDKAGEMIGCSGKHWGNMQTGTCKISDRYAVLLAALLLEKMDAPLKPNPQAMSIETLLPIRKTTTYFTLRTHQNQDVMTLAEIAQAYHISTGEALRIYLSHSETWLRKSQPSSDPEVYFVKPPESDPVPVFSLKGVARFALHIHTPRSETIHDHCLDLLVVQAKLEKPVIPAQQNPLIQVAQMIGFVDQKALKAFKQVNQRVHNLEQDQRTPEDLVQATLQFLQKLDTYKGKLHDLVNQIVLRASQLREDPFANNYASYSKVWREVHSHAVPAVKSKNEYRSVDQILGAIRHAESILHQLQAGNGHQQLQLRF